MINRALQFYFNHIGHKWCHLVSLCSAAVLGFRFCRGQQISIAGDILDQVHEGSAGV